MGQLENQTALITGGGTGIGLALARCFHQEGAAVVICGRREQVLQSAAADIAPQGQRVMYKVADISTEQDVVDLVSEAASWRRGLDILINNAGAIRINKPPEETTQAEWQYVIDTNITGTFLCCREAFRIMEKQETGGRIINLGSSSARVASGPGHSPYRASKHGMMGFSKNILLEGKDKKIGVTVINPSHVKTPMTEIIDQGLYDEDIPAYLEGWLDEKELKEGIHASCIAVENVAEIALYVATRTPDVTIPQIALYPTHKAHRSGRDV